MLQQVAHKILLAADIHEFMLQNPFLEILLFAKMSLGMFSELRLFVWKVVCFFFSTENYHFSVIEQIIYLFLDVQKYYWEPLSKNASDLQVLFRSYTAW